MTAQNPETEAEQQQTLDTEARIQLGSYDEPALDAVTKQAELRLRQATNAARRLNEPTPPVAGVVVGALGLIGVRRQPGRRRAREGKV